MKAVENMNKCMNDLLPNNKCNYAIKDELEDYYCCNDKSDKCATVVCKDDCKECDLFESNQK